MQAEAKRSCFFILTHYKSMLVPRAGSIIKADSEIFFERFDEAFAAIKKSKTQNKKLLEIKKKWPHKKHNAEDLDFTWASRIQKFDLTIGGPSQAEWLFDHNAQLYTATEAAPIAVPKSAAADWEWQANSIVAVEYRRHFYFGILKSRRGHTCKIVLPICSHNGRFKIIRRRTTQLMPYDHQALESHIHFRLQSLLAIDDLGATLKERAHIVDQNRLTQRAEADFSCPPLLQKGFLAFFKLTKFSCKKPQQQNAKVNQLELGVFATADLARAALKQDIQQTRHPKTNTLCYRITSIQVRKGENQTNEVIWNGSWEFDGQGRCHGWHDFADRPFKGRRAEDRAFEVGDLVSIIYFNNRLIPGIVIDVPRTPEKVHKGMDQSDDVYFISGINHDGSSWIDGDHRHEYGILPLMSPLSDVQVMNLASQLLSDAESEKYARMLRWAPSIDIDACESSS